MNDPELIRLGFIGAGGICEQRHLPNLTKMPGVELVAVCNRSPESSRRVQEKWGFARTVDDWRQIIEASDIDAVFIGTWPYRHCELSLAALAAGKHVFCQARMCMDWAEARQMVAAANAHAQQVAMVCPSPFRVRWERTVRELLASERFGHLLSVAVISTNSANCDLHQMSWRERRELSGLNILQVGIYAETLNAWCGDYLSLTATTSISHNKHDAHGRTVEIQIPQTVSMTGTLSGGVPCTEFHTGLAAGFERAEILLCGSAATCRVDLLAQQIVQHSAASTVGEMIDTVGDDWQVETNFLAAVRAARRGEPWQVSPSFSEAARYMRKMQAIDDSSRQSRLVNLSDEPS
ncbi:MAG: gfo/Idh/MocA family oxidoreductase [Planctomycetota bacterium]|nr:MAG: gfo/Idh/MocA family oxidoreductase [Planctomycetota bacterium]